MRYVFNLSEIRWSLHYAGVFVNGQCSRITFHVHGYVNCSMLFDNRNCLFKSGFCNYCHMSIDRGSNHDGFSVVRGSACTITKRVVMAMRPRR